MKSEIFELKMWINQTKRIKICIINYHKSVVMIYRPQLGRSLISFSAWEASQVRSRDASSDVDGKTSWYFCR